MYVAIATISIDQSERTLLLQVYLGFVQDFGSNGETGVISQEFVKSGNFEVDIFGLRYPAQSVSPQPAPPIRVANEGIKPVFGALDRYLLCTIVG